MAFLSSAVSGDVSAVSADCSAALPSGEGGRLEILVSGARAGGGGGLRSSGGNRAQRGRA